jgi:hypothetical protein
MTSSTSASRLRLRYPFLVLVAITCCVVLPSARAAGTTISGQITKLADGTPVQGAVVTVAGPHQVPIVATTGADGSFSLSPSGDGPYGVGVSATGYKAKALADVSAGGLSPITLEPATYVPLPVYAGSADSVVADAESGIFYASMNSGPEVYRTLDYGGSWQPVTPSYDDPAAGLSNSVGGSAIAASGVSGEVVVARSIDCANGLPSFRVSFSTDYGLTWHELTGVSFQGECTQNRLRLFWGHAGAGAPDVLMAALRLDDGSWKVWRADMSASTPAFVAEASDPFGQGSQIAVSDSASGSFIGKVSSDGALSFASLTASGRIVFDFTEVAGLPSPPQLLRLGGTREASAPPDGALVVGGSGPYRAVMLTKSAGAQSFSSSSLSAATDLPDTNPTNCAFGRLLGGSVAPTTTGSDGAGNAGSCWLQKSGTGNPLTLSTVMDGTDMAYDAHYGQPGDLVSIMPSISQGPKKWAKLDSSGSPTFTDFNRLATGGTDPESGGTSIRGITSPIVNDVAYGPAGAGEVAVAAQHVMLASKDGGKTMTEILPRGGRTSQAVQWWQGASGEWLLVGHTFNCDTPLLTAVRNWDGVTTLSEPNVSGSNCADLGGPPQGYWDTGGYAVGALATVPGTDTVFIGTGTWGEDKYGSGNHLYRASLTATDPPRLADLAKLDPAPVATLYSPLAMAYCPDTSSVAAPMRDVLFVATGQYGWATPDTRGSLLRITGATSGSPSTTVVGSIPHDAANTHLDDVRADCAAGVVYAGGNPGLYKSVDGGQSFAHLTILKPNGTPEGAVTAIGLNPADENDVTVASGSTAVYHSSDGGTTWTLVHDPTVERPSNVSDIEYAPGSSAPSIIGAILARSSAAVKKSTAAGKRELVGTSSGVFSGDLEAVSGLMGTSTSPKGKEGATVRVTTLGSDSHPATTTGPGSVLTVFHRSNGLYLTSESNGSWSIPVSIPGTTGSDDFPAASVDKKGSLRLAFARKGKSAGVYVSTMSKKGVWSNPTRVSSGAGDTLPAIAVTGAGRPRIRVAFLRSRGSARGVFLVSSTSTGWGRAVRVPGSKAADARPALGGPTLDVRSNRVELAFARAGRGIYFASLSASGWTKAVRISTVSGDSQPSLAIDANGASHVVFRRTHGRSAHGLYELKRAKAWSVRRIPQTTSTDGEASLARSGSMLVLAFSRPSGKVAGTYYDRESGSRWLAKPVRWSASKKDRNPSVGAAASGHGQVVVVYERG